MQGPAARLWAEAFPDVAPYSDVEQTVRGAALLISGTGWASSLEHMARKLARPAGVRSVAVIDHWANYEARFVRDGEQVWPDLFCVTDYYALAEACRVFPQDRVLLVPNHYLTGQLAEIERVPVPAVPELLYLLEPARSEWGRDCAGEFQGLDYFMQHYSRLGIPDDTPIRLRPHPSDPEGKYAEWLRSCRRSNMSVDATTPLAHAIGRASWVAGCESFALVLALMAGRKVFCTLPPWAPPCRLPHEGLIHVAELAGRV